MKCWISVSQALALRVREPTAATYVPICLRLPRLQQLGNDVELCTGVTRFPCAELATATDSVAGWPASVGIAPHAVCEANLSSQATRSLYDVPDCKHRDAAPSTGRR